jgi:5-methylthioadenosine/S-adenosylhomocysteine deaminase
MEKPVSQILIKNCYLITMNSNRDIYENGQILIENDLIKCVGIVDEALISPDAEVYDAESKIVLPGFINTHVHTSQQLGRGIADDVNLLVWLIDRIWPYESNLEYEDSLLSATACCVEMIRSGVTTFLEAGGQFVEAMVEAVTATGIRGCLSKSVMDTGVGLPEKWNKTTDEELAIQSGLYEKYNNTADGRVKIWFGLRTIFNNSDSLVIKTKQLADKYNTGIHMHIAEICEEIDFTKSKHKQGTLEHLDTLGVLGPNLLAVHAVWLTHKEVDLIKLNDVKVSHCPCSAMKVCLGFSPVPEMISKGIPVSIGTDGAPSNNSMDIFKDMYLASVIHKGRTLDPNVVCAETILEMLTINGSKCALMEKEIGSLEVGKKADLIILNPDSIHSLPVYNPVSSIVYSMSSQNVESTMCNGVWLMKEKKVLVLDEQELFGKIKIAAEKIKKINNFNFQTKFNVVSEK